MGLLGTVEPRENPAAPAMLSRPGKLTENAREMPTVRARQGDSWPECHEEIPRREFIHTAIAGEVPGLPSTRSPESATQPEAMDPKGCKSQP